MNYVIENESIRLTISSHGGEMVSLFRNGKERLWQNDNNTWPGHAPILFPYAGWVEMANHGVDAPKCRHGFLRGEEFRLASKSENRIALCYESKGERPYYPFSFRFLVTYALAGDSLEIGYEVENLGEEAMPFGIGAHESYALQDDVSNYEIRFGGTYELKSLKTGDCGKLSGDSVPLGNIDRIDLSSPLLEHSATIILGNVPFQEAMLHRKDGSFVARVSFGGFPHLLLWHPEGSCMICMEPWHNLPDTLGNEGAPFGEKEGILTLAPREKKAFLHVIEYGDTL